MISFMLIILLITKLDNKPYNESLILFYFILANGSKYNMMIFFYVAIPFSVIMVILFAPPAVLNLGTSVSSAHCVLAQNVNPLRIFCYLSKCHVRMQNMVARRK